MNDKVWRIFTDTGGTFTDCLAISPTGSTGRLKVLSSGAIRFGVVRWHSEREVTLSERAAVFALRDFDARSTGEQVTTRVLEQHGARVRLADAIVQGQSLELSTGETAPVLGARLLTRMAASEQLPPISLRLATTRGTNALLERRITPVVFFVTRGFADVLEIGDQRRPELFAIRIRKPRPYYDRVIEVHERLGADGSVLQVLDTDAIRCAIREARAAGFDAAAVALLHAWRNPVHEELVGELLREGGFTHVSLSGRMSARIGLRVRATTTVVNAALSGPIERFVATTAGALGSAGKIEVMTSAGGLLPADRFNPKDSLLSGPAAGLAGAQAVASASFPDEPARIITFDMGGTSTDVARIDGQILYTVSHRVGDAELLSPAMAVESVAAGGGSICAVEHGEPMVGPRSAGASPGPACYGAGGPLTLTDVNLLLGRIDVSRFEIPLDVGAARAAFDNVCAALPPGHEARENSELLLNAFVEIANERMAQAIRRVSVRQGYDPATHTLVAFGGAGGQHACAVASRLGISRILIPADCSLLSAVGLAVARRERMVEVQVLAGLEGFDFARTFADAEHRALSELSADLPGSPARVRRRIVRLRYSGQEHAIDLELDDAKTLRERFEAKSREVFGHVLPNRTVEVESIRVLAQCEDIQDRLPRQEPATVAVSASHSRESTGRIRVVDQSVLDSGETIDGPVVISGPRGTAVLDEGWTASMDATRALVLTRRGVASGHAAAAAFTRRELLGCSFQAIAEEMGELLRRTAISVNVKERLDFSCAITDARGELVVSAPHLPVHLGALGRCVREFVAVHPLGPGDVGLTNHPAFGGSHLPDITLIAPAFAATGELIGYVACRAHHAEIGGIVPGSLPPKATRLVEEGVVIPPINLVERGEPTWGSVRARFTRAAYPTRNIEENMADLGAQLAAVLLGVRSLNAVSNQYGVGEVADAMTTVVTRAEVRLREALTRLGSREGRAVNRLDDGAEIHIRIKVSSGRAEVDFTGTSGMHPRNFNAPPAVVGSAVLYVMRLLCGRDGQTDIPLNDGLMRPLSITVPPGMLAPTFDADPASCPAVGAGNVETSQQVVNCLLRAFGVCADGQGTMNNLLFGNSKFGYYETICGGSGAGPGFDGASGVHTHMTNTAITDAEVFETRYPVRLEQFAVRRGSGGAGKNMGGDGVVRELRFLQPVTLSVVSTHRGVGPSGLLGGENGKPGANSVVKADGSRSDLGACNTVELAAGDRVVIETPGGGGCGQA
ncbi:MAG: hydantoinase B/oxoprolinase family protein [Planctomycetes bacterium]|nr:hydantoinase B/oxoprolinase family protein [Planctomycetota bacterium]